MTSPPPFIYNLLSACSISCKTFTPFLHYCFFCVPLKKHSSFIWISKAYWEALEACCWFRILRKVSVGERRSQRGTDWGSRQRSEDKEPLFSHKKQHSLHCHWKCKMYSNPAYNLYQLLGELWCLWSKDGLYGKWVQAYRHNHWWVRSYWALLWRGSTPWPDTRGDVSPYLPSNSSRKKEMTNLIMAKPPNERQSIHFALEATSLCQTLFADCMCGPLQNNADVSSDDQQYAQYMARMHRIDATI